MTVEKYTPKYTLVAEQAVLGSLLLNSELWDDIHPIVSESNFYLSVHKIIFSAIQSLCLENIPVDLITIEQVLRNKYSKDEMDQLGGIAYLAELSKNTPSTANIVQYAKIVRLDSQTRQLHLLGNTLREESLNIHSQENFDELLNQVEKQLTDLTLNQLEQDTTASIDTVLNQLLNKMESSCNTANLVTGTPFGITQLDTHTAGAQNGDLIILAGRPSMGKTALSLVFAVSALENFKDKPIQYYSLEMPAEQIMARLLSMRALVNAKKIRQATLMSDEDWARMSETMHYIKTEWENRLLIDDSNYLTPQLLRTRVRRNIRKYGKPSIVIVDYLQLMSVPAFKNGQNRHMEITEISRTLKNLAKEIDCPVVALSQLNRNLEQRMDKRPLNADLRESGSLEQDADVILFVYRDEVYHNDSEYKGLAEIIIGKQRNGPIGTVFSRFKGEYSRFDSIPDNEYPNLRVIINE